MFLVLINQLNAKFKNIYKIFVFSFLTLISSIINHFDVKRLLSCALSSVDIDVVEFNVVELFIIEFGRFVDITSSPS
jgi:hypothetical protein